MEYYILKLYQEAKKKCPDVEQGFDRFEPKIKKIVIVCLVAMFAACAEMIVTMLLFPKQLWYFIGVSLCVVALFVLLGIDNKDQKKHMDKYVDSHKRKLEILEKVLITEFGIKSEEKVGELINIYQEYVDKKKEEEILQISSSIKENEIRKESLHEEIQQLQKSLTSIQTIQDNEIDITNHHEIQKIEKEIAKVQEEHKARIQKVQFPWYCNIDKSTI